LVERTPLAYLTVAVYAFELPKLVLDLERQSSRVSLILLAPVHHPPPSN